MVSFWSAHLNLPVSLYHHTLVISNGNSLQKYNMIWSPDRIVCNYLQKCQNTFLVLVTYDFQNSFLGVGRPYQLIPTQWNTDTYCITSSEHQPIEASTGPLASVKTRAQIPAGESRSLLDLDVGCHLFPPLPQSICLTFPGPRPRVEMCPVILA